MERLLAAFHSQQDAVIKAAQKLLSDEQAPRRQKLLADLIHNLQENISAEDRQEDSKWFEGRCLRLDPAPLGLVFIRSNRKILKFFKSTYIFLHQEMVLKIPPYCFIQYSFKIHVTFPPTDISLSTFTFI